MPKLPCISGRQAIKLLEKLGFVYLRQRGSHAILKKTLNGKAYGCVVPLHKELAIGTLHGLLRQAKVSTEEFLEVYES